MSSMLIRIRNPTKPVTAIPKRIQSCSSSLFTSISQLVLFHIFCLANTIGNTPIVVQLIHISFAVVKWDNTQHVSTKLHFLLLKRNLTFGSTHFLMTLDAHIAKICIFAKIGKQPNPFFLSSFC